MDKLSELKAYTRSLRLVYTREHMEEILEVAEQSNETYFEFMNRILSGEMKYRHDKAKTKRIKEAGFPYIKTLKEFDLSFCHSLTTRQFRQLSELTWIEGLYNLILAGPPGVGKTHLAIALAYHACEEGYRVSYTTMQMLVQYLRTQEIDLDLCQYLGHKKLNKIMQHLMPHLLFVVASYNQCYHES